MRKIAALLLALAACGGSGASAVSTTTSTTAPLAPPCAGLVGKPTAEVVAHGACTDDNGDIVLYVVLNRRCPDGRTLNWNDDGWGYSDGTWQSGEAPASCRM